MSGEREAAAVTMKTPTMRDVARQAGVSHMTVSRVINGDEAVSAATRHKVEQAISSLRFAPNAAARALSNAEPARVALLHHFPNPGSLGEYLIHLLQVSTLAHASLTIHQVGASGEGAAVVAELVADRVRGAILTPPLGDDKALVERLRGHGIAIVATGSTAPDCSVPSIGIDDRAAARAMTEHLVRLGHRRIGFIKGRTTHASTVLRHEGYRAALAAAGIEFDAGLVAEGLYTYQSGLSAAERLLGLSVPPTAIFAGNDDMAAATISVAHRRGIEVPEELSVCGFDDSPLSTTIWPELTTIRQPFAELTAQAFGRVLQAMKGSEGDMRRVDLAHELVIRHSVAPPPGIGAPIGRR